LPNYLNAAGEHKRAKSYGTAVSVVPGRFDRRIGRAAVDFRCTRDSHDITRIYDVSHDSLAPVRRDAMKAPELICAPTLSKFIGE